MHLVWSFPKSKWGEPLYRKCEYCSQPISTVPHVRRRQFQQYFHVDCAVESKLTTTDELTRAFSKAHFVPFVYDAPPPEEPKPVDPSDGFYQQKFEVTDEPEPPVEEIPPEPPAPVEGTYRRKSTYRIPTDPTSSRGLMICPTGE